MGDWMFGYSDAQGFNTKGANANLIEDVMTEAHEHGFEFVEFHAEIGVNALETFDDQRLKKIRALSESTGVRLSVHTSSAINVAEVSPFFRDAVQPYLTRFVELASALDAISLTVHGGFHFSSIVELRKEAAIKHLRQACELAEKMNVQLVLENHNKEPEHAEVNYIPSTIDELRWYFDQLPSPALKWTFETGHANLRPEGVPGFIEAFGTDRLFQLRLSDNQGDYEHHVPPGKGTANYEPLLERLRSDKWHGPILLSFGPMQELITVRDRYKKLVEAW